MASGAPCLAASANSPARSRLITSTPGCTLPPSDKRRCLVVWQQIHLHSSLKINQDSPILFATTIGPLVSPKDAWGRGRWSRTSTQDSQECHATTWQANRRAQIGSGSSPESKPNSASASVQRVVRRAEGVVHSGKRSAKIFREHIVFSQKKRRT